MNCIIGAGPTGLGAAYELERHGAPWKLFEAESYPGGLSASFVSDGFAWDIGGHVTFSHYDEFDQLLDRLIPKGGWVFHDRQAYISICDKWIPYPFQNNIKYLPEKERDICLRGLKKLAESPLLSEVCNFQEWINQIAGSGVADLFLNPYNEKVWAYSPSKLSVNWLGERVARPDLTKIINSIENNAGDTDWGPNTKFRFPLNGGTGAIWTRLASSLPQENINYNHKLKAVDTRSKSLLFQNGHTESYDNLITTMPLDKLMEITDLRVGRSASELLHNTVHVIGIGLSGTLPSACTDKTWLYFPEHDYPFYRVTIFSRYSVNNAPENCYSLMAEVSESPETPLQCSDIVGECLKALRLAGLVNSDDKVVSSWSKTVEYGYPIPSLNRDDILDSLLPLLEKNRIYSRGRFGAWKYEVGNMDHSYSQGVEVVARILDGTSEVTLNDPDYVNSMHSKGL